VLLVLSFEHINLYYLQHLGLSSPTPAHERVELKGNSSQPVSCTRRHHTPGRVRQPAPALVEAGPGSPPPRQRRDQSGSTSCAARHASSPTKAPSAAALRHADCNQRTLSPPDSPHRHRLSPHRQPMASPRSRNPVGPQNGPTDSGVSRPSSSPSAARDLQANADYIHASHGEVPGYQQQQTANVGLIVGGGRIVFVRCGRW